MSLLEEWRQAAYNSATSQEEYDAFWNNYFLLEKGIYESLLSAKRAVKGTIPSLAKKYKVDTMTMVGFLDGINDSLKTPNPIEEMTEDTEVSLDIDLEKLYYNMVGAKAQWLYELPMWKVLLSDEKRKELYKESRSASTVVKGAKIGRNEPCPCGSGKKYKFCCGR